jgi:hypothetical protein
MFGHARLLKEQALSKSIGGNNVTLAKPLPLQAQAEPCESTKACSSEETGLCICFIGVEDVVKSLFKSLHHKHVVL